VPVPPEWFQSLVGVATWHILRGHTLEDALPGMRRKVGGASPVEYQAAYQEAFRAVQTAEIAREQDPSAPLSEALLGEEPLSPFVDVRVSVGVKGADGGWLFVRQMKITLPWSATREQAEAQAKALFLQKSYGVQDEMLQAEITWGLRY
jgi:hypothetical protein